MNGWGLQWLLVCLLVCSSTCYTPLEGRSFIFYYLWYGNTTKDRAWQHWDHEVLPHWRESENKRYSNIGQRFKPPGDLHSPFYPQRGPYSSMDPALLDEHFAEIKSLSPSLVIVLSWWGQASKKGTSDTQGVQTDNRIAGVLKAAERTGVLIAWHLEPYPGRSARSVTEDVRYLESKYGSSPAVLREAGKAVFFIYDSYHVSAEDWQRELGSKKGPKGIFIGLWLERHHGTDILEGGFDGFYSYFASAGFVYGATPRNWPHMCAEAKVRDMACILSVGPGYVDEGIRPWNSHNTKDRRGGAYFDDMFAAALEARPTSVSITSYNEWGEGTQIEPAVPYTHAATGREYVDYGEGGPNLYLNRTKLWLSRFADLTAPVTGGFYDPYEGAKAPVAPPEPPDL